MAYKLIAFDMDGTLLNSEKQISEKTIEAIDYAASNGKIVVLSTGRCLPELDEYLDKLKSVRYMCCVSGGYVYDVEEKKFIYKNSIPEDTIREILNVTKEEDCMIHLLNELSIVKRDDVLNMDHFQMSIYRPMFDKVTTMVEDVYRYFEDEHPEVMKLNIYHTSSEARDRTRARLKSAPLELINAEITSLECSNKGVTKGVGLMKLCEYLGIDIQDTIAVGDADNDLAVLNTAGLSIAMGNANENVKKACDVVVADNDSDGCAEAVYEYLMK